MSCPINGIRENQRDALLSILQILSLPINLTASLTFTESMPESNNPPPSRGLPLALKITALALVAAAVVVYKLDPFDPAALPAEELSGAPAAVAECNGKVLQGAERIGVEDLAAAEDLAYDSELGLVYTGDADGWLKRVRLNDSAVENWAFTGGRPLGVALGPDGDVFVADADKVPHCKSV